MDDIERAIVGDYGATDLGERILAALGAQGIDTDHLTQEILAEIDHIHGGGYRNTVEHAAMARFAPEMRVLDIGCGIGGPARYFAQEFGCHVTGIDVTQDYVDVAAMLTELCGLGGLVDFRCADACSLPFDAESFDAVWCLNVTMNIADRGRFYAEMRRVLKPGGQLALSELGQGPGGPPYYPLSWARDPSYSFLVSPDQLRAGLEAAGFRITAWIDEAARRKQAGGSIARSTSRLPPALVSTLVRGDDYPERQANTGKSIMEDRLTNVRLMAERAG